MLAAAFAIAMLTTGALPAAPLFGVGPSAVSAAAAASPRPLEHLRGIYRQRAIEIATVGTRTIHLTRFTRFRRCGRFRGIAEDFNDHLVDVTGRDVPGFGFVAGFIDTIEGCKASTPGGQAAGGRSWPPFAAASRPAAAD